MKTNQTSLKIALVTGATLLAASSALHADPLVGKTLRPGVTVKSVVAEKLLEGKPRRGGFIWEDLERRSPVTAPRAEAKGAALNWGTVTTGESALLLADNSRTT
ncbi:MAG: hypothetical protein AB8B57_17165, partial [Congregibacter sp.]